MILRTLIALLIRGVTAMVLLGAGFAYAGSQDGPYVLFLNLSGDKFVGDILAHRVEHGDPCTEPRMSIRYDTDWIDLALVTKAFLKNDKAAIAKLDKLMRRNYSKVIDTGFDGIVIYDEESGPRFSVLVRGSKRIARQHLSRREIATELVDGFCTVVPPIVRAK